MADKENVFDKLEYSQKHGNPCTLTGADVTCHPSPPICCP